ncbi:hypothetical protein J2S74_002976 [Evansella vedderi]|uniref:Uncharacterized protein n=1 Tax=Evansella vedderi TaxID=38282 RepID=A0ABT9ZXM1_9BACI|nr:hypothetical protein [Evansella vedderi]MDQ0255594.1 hypothetical protein [Evansella vedderi]
MKNLSPDEIYELFEKIHSKLVEEFPEGTVRFTNSNKLTTAYIPHEAYIERLNDVCGPFWSFVRNGEAKIHRNEKLVEVSGVLRILDAERDGTGFHKFNVNEKGDIINLNYAIRSAKSDAIRDACDLFGMGWKDLHKFRKGEKVTSVPESSMSGRECIKCRNPLSNEDIQELKKLNVDIDFCRKDIPPHFYNHKR